MEVTYRNEPIDLRLAWKTLPWFDRLIARGMDFWFFIAIGLLPGCFWLVMTRRWGALAFTAVVFGVAFVALLVVAHRATKRNFAGLSEQTMRLEPEWIEARTATSWSRRRWNQVTEVVDLPGGTVLGIDFWLWHVVPRRAFASEEAAQQFAVTATRYWQQAQQNPPSATELSIPDWFQLPPPLSRVSYQATKDDLLNVLLTGGGKRPQQGQSSSQSAKRPGCGWGILFGFLAVILMILIGQSSRSTLARDEPFLGMLCLFGFGPLWFVGFLADRRLRARLTVRRTTLPHEELTVTISGCMFRSSGRLSFLHWHDVAAVLLADAAIAFQLRGNQFHVIPKRGLNSPQEAEQLYEQCLEFWTAAQADPNKPIAVPAMIIDSNNPYEPPREV